MFGISDPKTAAYLRVGIVVASLAALVVSTKVIAGAVKDVGSLVSIRMASPFPIPSFSFEPSVSQQIEMRMRGAEKQAVPISKPCVRPEVYQLASGRGGFIWYLRDKHDRVVAESRITYGSETEARNAADEAATAHACNTKLTETRRQHNL